MCWVMPPASPEATRVLRMASRREVFAVVDVAHEGDDGGAELEGGVDGDFLLLRLVLLRRGGRGRMGGAVPLLRMEGVAELRADLLGRFLVEDLGEGGEDVQLHQVMDELERLQAEVPGEVLDDDGALDGDQLFLGSGFRTRIAAADGSFDGRGRCRGRSGSGGSRGFRGGGGGLGGRHAVGWGWIGRRLRGRDRRVVWLRGLSGGVDLVEGGLADALGDFGVDVGEGVEEVGLLDLGDRLGADEAGVDDLVGEGGVDGEGEGQFAGGLRDLLGEVFLGGVFLRDVDLPADAEDLRGEAGVLPLRPRTRE